MISAFGVEHTVSKAAWKAFYPVPPGVGKIPRSRLKIVPSGRGRNIAYSAALKHRPDKVIGSIGLGRKPDPPHYIAGIGVHPGFRRRGIGQALLAESRKNDAVVHSGTRSNLGEKFAVGVERKSGAKPAPSDRGSRYVKAGQGKLPRPKRTVSQDETAEPYVSDRGVQRNRAYRPQTTSRVRRGR